MGLGKGVAPAICEHAVLTRIVEMAWPDRTPRQVWGKRQTPSEPHNLLEVKTREHYEQITCVIFDLTQMVFAFPALVRSWVRTNTDLFHTTIKDDDLEKALSRCIESGLGIGTIEQDSNGQYVVEVDTFTDEILVGFIVDRLLNIKRGLTGRLPNLKAAYYVLDGERPAAKSVTARKRVDSQARGKPYRLRQKALEILGHENERMMQPVKVTNDGQEMWQGSLSDYILCRENLWRLVESLRKKIELIGAPKGNGVDVFLARGWHSQYDQTSGWFRVAGDRPEGTKPLRDYFNEKIDMEADAMMVRLGRLVVEHFQGPCLMSTVDTDILASMISMGSPDLYWAKKLSFNDRTKVKLLTTTSKSGSKREHTPECVDLCTICPLEEPKIREGYCLQSFPDTFLFSGHRLSEPSKWSTLEAEQRLVAVFVLLMAGCDFCEKLKDFGVRSVAEMLSKQPTLTNVRFSRITHTKNMTREVEQGMLYDCLEKLANAVRFPWRCGNFVCLVEIDFESAETLIRSAIKPRWTEGRDWKPFIRRVCYSLMTLSAPGMGIEKEVQNNSRLALNFGYDSSKGYHYV